MAASGDDNGGDSQSQAKFLDLQEQMAATKEKWVKMMEHSSRKGTTDDQRKAAKDAKKEYIALSTSFQEFVNRFSSSGIQNLDPAWFETYEGWIQQVAQEIDNVGASSAVSGHYAQFLDLQARMEATKKRVQEMADNLKRAAEHAKKEFEGCSQRFQEFLNQSCPSGVQNLDPSLFQTFHLGIQEFAHELKAINFRCQNPLVLKNVQTTRTAKERRRLTDLRASRSVSDQSVAENIAAEALLQVGFKVTETDGRKIHQEEVEELNSEVGFDFLSLEQPKAPANRDELRPLPPMNPTPELSPAEAETYGRKIQEEVEELNSEVGFDFLNLKQRKAPASRDGLPPLPPKNPIRKLSPAAAVRIEVKKEMEAFNLQLTGIHRSFTEIVMEIYGFGQKEAEKVEKEASYTLTGLSPYQGSTPGTGRLADAKILKWNGVSGTKQLLQETKAKENQNKIPGLLLKIWVFCLETQMYILVGHLRAMMSGNEAAMERLRQLRASLIKLRDDSDGMVPIVVHRIVASMESQRPAEQSDLNSDQQEALYRKLGFDKVIDSIENMILWLRLVLITSGRPLGAVNQLVLTISEQLLGKAEEEMRRIEGRIIEDGENAQKKRKRGDETGGGGSGNSEVL